MSVPGGIIRVYNRDIVIAMFVSGVRPTDALRLAKCCDAAHDRSSCFLRDLPPVSLI